MNTSKGYELPEGWHPIETVPIGVQVNIIYARGATEQCTYGHHHQVANAKAIGWQHITPLKKVERYRVDNDGPNGCFVMDTKPTAHSPVMAQFTKNHPSPEAAAKAEAKRLNEQEGV